MAAGAREPGELEADLLRWAAALTRDTEEARLLVQRTLISAGEEGGLGTPPNRVRLFGLLRRAYHSIERSRGRRRIHDAQVTALSRGGPAAMAGPE